MLLCYINRLFRAVLCDVVFIGCLGHYVVMLYQQAV